MDTATHGEKGFLVRRWLPFGAALAVALLLRLIALGERPLHHDEGVNAWFLGSLLDGYQWSYDPARFHGPFLYFFSLPFALLLGESDAALRLPVALTSALTPLLLLPLRRRLGVAGVTAAAWLLATSPALVYYGRDLIHETYLAALTVALVALASRYLETRRDGFLISAAACLGLLATVKETYVLTLATLGAAALLTRWWTAGGLGLRELWPLRLGAAGTAWKAGLAFAVPYVLFYTSFFTHPAGLADSVRTFLLWGEKGVEGAEHAKPWDYFPRLLGSFEGTAVVCALLGGALAIRRRNPFGTFCALWAAGQLALYSAIHYKTPWLVVNVVVPAALTGGALFQELFERPAWPAGGALKAGVAAAFALALAWSGWRAVEVALLRYDDDRLGLVYAQTHREAKDLLAYVRAETEGQDRSLKIYTRHGWPLPWYLRDLPGMAYRLEVDANPDADLLIVGPQLEEQVRSRLKGKYRRSTFLLRVREPVAVYVNEGLLGRGGGGSGRGSTDL